MLQHQNELYVRKGKTGNIEAELKLSIDHWVLLASSLKVKDLTFNDITMTCDKVKDVIENEWLSTEDNEIWFPLIDYGNLIRDRTVVPRTNDFINPLAYWRPVFYLANILKKGFCKVGYTFESEPFMTKYFRSMALYIIDKNYGLDESRVALLNARAEVDSTYSFVFDPNNTGPIKLVRFPNVIDNIAGYFNEDGSIYSGSGEVNINGLVQVQPAATPTEFSIEVRNSFDGRIYQRENFNHSEEGTIHEFEFDIKNISVTDIHKMRVIINQPLVGNQTPAGLSVLSGSFIEYEGVRKYWDNGDTFNLADIIDPDLLFVDLIKGATGGLNLKWYTNVTDKKVMALPPFAQDYYGEIAEGYYIETQVEDFTLKLDPKSVNVTTPEINSERYVEVLYAKSNDKYITEAEFKNELWSRKIDRGPKFTINETKEVRNTLFEPTSYKREKQGANYEIIIPKMVGETEHTWDINPRILITYGNVIQETDADIRYCTFDDPQTKLIPTAGQYLPVKIGNIHNNLGAVLEYNDQNLIYGLNEELPEREIKTLYAFVYLRWLLEELNNITIEYLTHITPVEFRRIDLRSYYIINHLGRTLKARIKRVNDFHYCSNIPTPITYVPEIQVSDLCNIVGDEPGDGDPICNNNPAIICVNQGNGCYTFSIGGINNSPIIGTVFEYRIIGTLNWIVIPNLTIISAELCAITESYEVRATVSYDTLDGLECPDVTTAIKQVEPCPEIDWEIRCVGSIDLTTNIPIMTAIILSNDPSITDWVTISFEWSDSYGPVFNWQPYIEGDEIIGEGIRLFRATVQYPGCDPFDIPITDCSVDISPIPPPFNCSSINVYLTCVEDENNCFTFQLNGSIPNGLDYYINIEYQYSDDGVTWSPWIQWDMETPICHQYVRARGYIIFCDDVCPMYCIPTIFCEGPDCDPFEVGTSLNIALCNDGNV